MWAGTALSSSRTCGTALNVVCKLNEYPIDLNQMAKSKTLKLTKGQLFNHYAVVPFLLIVPILTTYSLFQIYVTKNYIGVRSAQEMIWTGYPWIALAILAYVVQRKRLQFKEFKIPVDGEHFKKAGLDTAAKLHWKIKHISGKTIVAIRPGTISSGGSWGELITIFNEHDKILINSICDPNNIISVASWGWNRKNIKTFIEAL